MATVNIGGDSRDPNYRYKMPKMQTKIEGRGNGIKTVVVNMEAISKALHRHPDFTTKFFGIEQGSLTRYDSKNGQGTVNGEKSLAQMTATLDKFIEKFVLCKKCRLPETDIVGGKKGTIFFHCNACGHHVEGDYTHKLTNFIATHESLKAKKGKSTVEESRAKSVSGDLPVDAAAGKSEDTTQPDPEAADDNSGEVAEGMEGPEIDGTEIADNLGTQVFKEHFTIEKLGQFTHCVSEAKPKLSDAQGVIPADVQIGFLIGLEEMFEQNSSSLPHLPGILQYLYNEDIIEEDSFVSWKDHNSRYESVLAAAEGFFSWLLEAEEDEDEEGN